MMKIPEKKILIVIIVFSSIMPLHTFIWNLYPPEGTVYNGIDGEAILYSAISSAKWDFENPWILENEPVPKLIFFMPFLGSVYLFAFLGIIASILNISMLVVYVFFKFIAMFIFLLVSYNFICHLMRNKNECNAAFFIFAFSAGLMGLIQIHKLFNITELSLIGMGVGSYRILGFFTALSLASGLASIIFIMRKKPLTSGFFAGLAMLIYPMHGLASFIVISIYILLNYENKIKTIFKVGLPAIPFGLAWVLPYIINNTFFVQYFKQNSVGSIVFPPSVVLGLGPGILFVLYELYHKFNINDIERNKRICCISAIILSFILFSLAYISQPSISVVNPGFPSMAEKYGFSWMLKIASDYSIIFEMPFIIIMLKFLSDSIMLNENKEYKFVFVWFFMLMLLAFTPPKYTGLFVDKYLIFFYIPALLIASKGVCRFSGKYGFSIGKVVLLIIIFSLPTILLMNTYIQMMPRERYYQNPSENIEFYSRSEYNALIFLKSQPHGTALSSERISMYLPYYSDKKSLLFSDDRFAFDVDIKKQGYEKFYLAPNKDFLKKYNITYIFYDRFEQKNFTVTLDNIDFLEKIYDDNETNIYRSRK